MTVDFTDLGAIAHNLKDVYGSTLINQFEDEKTLYNKVPKGDLRLGGNGYVFATRLERSQSSGARDESQILPDPLAGKGVQGTIVPKHIYGTMKITGQAIDAARGGDTSFVNQLTDNMDDVYQSLLVDLNRQCWCDGYGLIGTLSAVSDTLTTSTTTWTVTMDNTRGVMYAKPGMVVDFFESTAIDQSSVASRISSIDRSAKTMEMEYNDGSYKSQHPIVAAQSYSIAAATVASGAFMVRSGARNATHSTSNTATEIIGMEGIFDDATLLATYENITVATYPKWSANILSNSSVDRELEVDLMLQACDLVQTESGKNINKMWMGLGQRRKYANIHLPDVRFAPTKLEGGYETLTFNAGDGSVEIMIDPVCQPGKIFCHPEGGIKKYEQTPLGWMDDDGSKMHRRFQYDEWLLALRVRTNLGTEQRNCLCLIKDLVEPDLYA